MANSNTLILAVASLVAVVFLTLPHGVDMHTDEVAAFCSSVCWEENTLALQCETEKCNENGPRRRYYRCSDRCSRNATRCWDMCRENFHEILEQCLPECTDLNVYEHCMIDCFTHRALVMKYRTQYGNNAPTPPTVPLPPGAFA